MDTDLINPADALRALVNELRELWEDMPFPDFPVPTDMRFWLEQMSPRTARAIRPTPVQHEVVPRLRQATLELGRKVSSLLQVREGAGWQMPMFESLSSLGEITSEIGAIEAAMKRWLRRGAGVSDIRLELERIAFLRNSNAHDPEGKRTAAAVEPTSVRDMISRFKSYYNIVRRDAHATLDWIKVNVRPLVERISGALWRLISSLSNPKEWSISGSLGVGVLGFFQGSVGLQVTFDMGRKLAVGSAVP